MDYRTQTKQDCKPRPMASHRTCQTEEDALASTLWEPFQLPTLAQFSRDHPQKVSSPHRRTGPLSVSLYSSGGSTSGISGRTQDLMKQILKPPLFSFHPPLSASRVTPHGDPGTQFQL